MRKHNHYFKPCPFTEVDVYRVLKLYKVHDPCLQHIAKKALCAGERGHKDMRRDLQDIVDTAQRAIDMLDEEQRDQRAAEDAVLDMLHNATEYVAPEEGVTFRVMGGGGGGGNRGVTPTDRTILVKPETVYSDTPGVSTYDASKYRVQEEAAEPVVNLEQCMGTRDVCAMCGDALPRVLCVFDPQTLQPYHPECHEAVLQFRAAMDL